MDFKPLGNWIDLIWVHPLNAPILIVFKFGDNVTSSSLWQDENAAWAIVVTEEGILILCI